MTVKLNPRVETRLTAQAQQMGVDPGALIEQMFERQFPADEPESHEVQGELDELMENLNRHRIEIGERPLVSLTSRAIEYLLARIQAEATDDPEEIRKAQADLDEMKETLNAERIRSGAAPIF